MQMNPYPDPNLYRNISNETVCINKYAPERKLCPEIKHVLFYMLSQLLLFTTYGGVIKNKNMVQQELYLRVQLANSHILSFVSFFFFF